jgi:hypothetical protein
MIVNRIGDCISVYLRGKDTSVTFNKDLYNRLCELARLCNEAETKEKLDTYVSEVLALLEEDSGKLEYSNEFSDSGLMYNPVKRQYYFTGSEIPVPSILIDRIRESYSKGIDYCPLIKCWKRFLRNPNIVNNPLLIEHFVEYLGAIYVDPVKLGFYLDEGYSEKVAEELASTYEIKITSEGLLSCYKTSQEIEHVYKESEEGIIVKVDKYKKRFDIYTGEITGDNRDEYELEQRVFMPLIMGTGGEAFSCHLPGDKPNYGHIIKIGHVHSLPSWESVNCNSRESAVKGLHVGNLSYIHNWGGDIHICLVCPSKIGAICSWQSDQAMRVLEYYVYGSMVSVNHSIYHSSSYDPLVDGAYNN